ncbi:MAG: transaldolase family protein [Lachnospiraceae bacterium]|nr:transaldolase family protein [Lachnospiraceae bacterium]
MKILIDDADLTKIEQFFDMYPYDGVTTNPTILSKTGNPDPMDQLKKIVALMPEGTDLHAQVLSSKAEDMVKEAEHMVEVLGKGKINMYVKVPVTAEGLKAISILSKKGINVTATAVYGVMPAFMAAKAGAKFLAPYVNRLDVLGYDGVKIAIDIHTAVKAAGYEAEVLGASFKNSQQILDMAKAGIGSVTVGSEPLAKLAYNGVAEDAVKVFINDFEGCCGEGKTMLDFE